MYNDLKLLCEFLFRELNEDVFNGLNDLVLLLLHCTQFIFWNAVDIFINAVLRILLPTWMTHVGFGRKKNA